MQPQKSVLLADDNQEFLLALTRQFQELGVRVMTAADGLDALMLTARDVPDLIVLDVDLPGADGLTICEKLAQTATTSDIPVIILTSKSDDKTRQRCEALGAHYIHKELKYWEHLNLVLGDYLDVESGAPVQATLKPELSPEIAAESAAPKILVIDDDPQITRALKIRLSALGLDVFEASNASSGTYLAWTEHPDLIITDQNMPEMSGENFIIKLKNDKETKDIPIIVITGQTVDGREDFGLRRDMLGLRGAVAYLTKPLDFNELIRTIENHIKVPLPPSSSAKSAAR